MAVITVKRYFGYFVCVIFVTKKDLIARVQSSPVSSIILCSLVDPNRSSQVAQQLLFDC